MLIFDGFYCKYAKLIDPEEDLIKLYPTKEKENECAFLKDDLLDTSFHLYFKIADKNLNTLLIVVRTKEKHLNGPSFAISIPEPMKDINTDIFYQKLDITTPKYYKINPNTLTSNVIISSSNEIALSIIYGSLSSGKVATLPKYRSQLFAVNKKEQSNSEINDEQIIFVKLYGGSGSVNLE